MSLAEEKLLIIHADDLGLCHSVNGAIFEAFDRKVISSASIMTPCPWFWEAAQRIRRSPDLDIGIHLTFTSEWESVRWRPLIADEAAARMIDRHGAFYAHTEEIKADLPSFEREAIAQIDLAIRNGIRPSHVDSHMYSLLTRDRLNAYLRAAASLRLAYMLPAAFNGRAIKVADPNRHTHTIDNLIFASEDIPKDAWMDFYIESLGKIEPGVHQLLVHPGIDNEELRALTGNGVPWGAEWRQRDYDVLMSSAFEKSLIRHKIKVISWKDYVNLNPRPTAASTGL